MSPRTMERCSCGDPACPWCGTAQGYDPEAERTPPQPRHPRLVAKLEANAAAQRAKAHRAARRREVAEAAMGVITPRQAVEQITKTLSYYEGQVWTHDMAVERARNLVSWLQLTRIGEVKS